MGSGKDGVQIVKNISKGYSECIEFEFLCAWWTVFKNPSCL